ncbi:(5-formylfuran-3-yl)methyl phosphate synthase [Stieleria sp. JC731]|uniref:(5-formylfuran-3-yl)methyl phosphate synthase n=1 Tax=Pirellulaceae TaxID=2691357 RepID=UPI001E300EC4|nr:(5-formylfuran-3-yl)methyl phosphate synthase [Stieleria sp. JC731]MCC9599443.1 (5-formylfuran-3-yl)methyl phosphate synthase [Stieleria sp. JC731]
MSKLIAPKDQSADRHEDQPNEQRYKRPHFIPRLLVSVRDIDEMRIALAEGIDLIDLKEPNDGPLSATATDIWTQASNLTEQLPPRQIGLSLALGEADTAIPLSAHVPQSVSFAKAGPSGIGSKDELTKLWNRLRSQLPSQTTLVAVAYADAEQAKTISPEQVIDAAADAGLTHFLIDTFNKQHGSSLELLGTERLARIARQAQDVGLWWALAGSLTLSDAQELLDLKIRPNCFAVRGDVCRTDRRGQIDALLIRHWKAMLSG